MKKKERIQCHTFIGTVSLVIVKKFLFKVEGMSPRYMCVVRDCPNVYMGQWQPGYAVVDRMSGFIVQYSDNISHNAQPKEIIKAFFARMGELGVSPNDIATLPKEDAKWSEFELSALPVVVKMYVKKIHGIYL